MWLLWDIVCYIVALNRTEIYIRIPTHVKNLYEMFKMHLLPSTRETCMLGAQPCLGKDDILGGSECLKTSIKVNGSSG